MDITIVRDEYGQMWAVCEHETLFGFSHSREEKSWRFWMPGRAFDPMVFKGRFPLSYFQDACRATWFIRHGEGMGDIVIVVKGRNYIGLK